MAGSFMGIPDDALIHFGFGAGINGAQSRMGIDDNDAMRNLLVMTIAKELFDLARGGKVDLGEILIGLLGGKAAQMAPRKASQPRVQTGLGLNSVRLKSNL